MSIILKCACGICGTQFDLNPQHYKSMGHQNMPKACPQCLDKKQNQRPQKVANREELFYQANVELTFPITMEYNAPKRKGDTPFYRTHIDGSTINARWGAGGGDKSGSLTIYANHPYHQGSRVSIRHMQVTNTDQQGNTRTVEYLHLDNPIDEQPLYQLRQTTYYHKTTLKGLGRQINKPAPIMPDTLVWQRHFTIALRSGRGATTELWYIAEAGDIAIEQNAEGE